MDNQIKQLLTDASKDLLYPSESDYPFDYVEWETGNEKLTKKRIRQLTGKAGKEPVKSVSLEDFFKQVTEEKDWYGEEEKATAERFRKLQQVLENNLTHVRVFKVGKIEIDAYIVGKTNEGKCAGLSTKVVET
ncbi:nuclease A inhibitor family protein [Rhodocytophaga aerolata]|uniref:Nuclease A inhibitor family protein n=1 Tax=Rhodocytophaga aerolata TaxID=455078 RepID=A0ABT8R0V0_9BACT|nr:nuclease A inhibitor family protein [Rhodocytophaga aerolata]MDO1445716.1 nuclease A inhibitor family protein [Rhodocytophaga aerolata]